MANVRVNVHTNSSQFWCVVAGHAKLMVTDVTSVAPGVARANGPHSGRRVPPAQTGHIRSAGHHPPKRTTFSRDGCHPRKRAMSRGAGPLVRGRGHRSVTTMLAASSRDTRTRAGRNPDAHRTPARADLPYASERTVTANEITAGSNLPYTGERGRQGSGSGAGPADRGSVGPVSRCGSHRQRPFYAQRPPLRTTGSRDHARLSGGIAPREGPRHISEGSMRRACVLTCVVATAAPRPRYDSRQPESSARLVYPSLRSARLMWFSTVRTLR